MALTPEHDRFLLKIYARAVDAVTERGGVSRRHAHSAIVGRTVMTETDLRVFGEALGVSAPDADAICDELAANSLITKRGYIVEMTEHGLDYASKLSDVPQN